LLVAIGGVAITAEFVVGNGAGGDAVATTVFCAQALFVEATNIRVNISLSGVFIAPSMMIGEHSLRLDNLGNEVKQTRYN
jgi:hypothetical protein